MRVMNQSLRPLIGIYVVVYFDDILIYSRSEAKHLHHICDVLLILRAEKFFASPSKCSFCTDSILFLEYRISAVGIGVDELKIAAIKDWPTPTSVTKIRSFHGLGSFYHLLICHFSLIVAPLTNVMNGKTFSWPPQAYASFQTIKLRLTSAPLLALLDFSTPFELYSDASKVGIGVVLTQAGRPVTFFSEKVTGAPSRYDTYDIEFYVVVCVVRHWYYYLFQREFILYTDHEALRHLSFWISYPPDMPSGPHFFSSSHLLSVIMRERTIESLMH